jgi:hypothetical protein
MHTSRLSYRLQVYNLCLGLGVSALDRIKDRIEHRIYKDRVESSKDRVESLKITQYLNTILHDVRDVCFRSNFKVRKDRIESL